MSQREKMTVAVSDVCTPHPTICWPVSFQTQFGTGDIYMVKSKREYIRNSWEKQVLFYQSTILGLSCSLFCG